jgi:LacI family transcriptional regulator
MVETICLATRHLIGQGHRRVALVLHGLRSQVYAEREQGYRSALEEASIAFDQSLVFPWELGSDQHALWTRIKTANPRPTGVVLYNNELAADILSLIRQDGFRVPQDVALITHGNSKWNERLEVPLSAVDSDPGELAEAIVDSLLKQIKTPELPPRTVLLRPRLFARASSLVTKTNTRSDR